MSTVINKPVLLKATAGEQVTLEVKSAGAGAALFAWATADCYEQLSDAYTFMELRKVSPEAGDVLYSTLRRPFLTLAASSPPRAIDLLLHDRWHERPKSASILWDIARDQGIVSPSVKDWPYAINLFVSTRVTQSGDLVDEALVAPAGSQIRLAARVDMILALLPARDGSLSFAP